MILSTPSSPVAMAPTAEGRKDAVGQGATQLQAQGQAAVAAAVSPCTCAVAGQLQLFILAMLHKCEIRGHGPVTARSTRRKSPYACRTRSGALSSQSAAYSLVRSPLSSAGRW